MKTPRTYGKTSLRTYNKPLKATSDCGVRPYQSRSQHSGWTHTKWASVKGPDIAKQAMGAARERISR